MNKTKKISVISILGAVTVVLALISNYVSFGSVNINLALIPIVIGACIYGEVVGLALGVVDGIIILFAPSTLSFFAPHNILATVILCLLKTGLGGFVAGYIFKLLKSKNDFLGVILASISLLIVNTLIFLIGVFIFFVPVYSSISNGQNVYIFIITSVLTVNFLIEIILNIILIPSMYRLIKFKRK